MHIGTHNLKHLFDRHRHELEYARDTNNSTAHKGTFNDAHNAVFMRLFVYYYPHTHKQFSLSASISKSDHAAVGKCVFIQGSLWKQ